MAGELPTLAFFMDGPLTVVVLRGYESRPGAAPGPGEAKVDLNRGRGGVMGVRIEGDLNL